MVVDSEIVKRKLRDLRVVDLKNELERRNLDKSGVKATLVERLAKVNFFETENNSSLLKSNNVLLILCMYVLTKFSCNALGSTG